MNLAVIGLRLLVGGLFFGHGSQKLFGWFGGGGLDATGSGFQSMGLKPGKTHATIAGICEAGGGAGVALGLCTPLSAAAIIGVMVQAIRSVHMSKGPWNSDGGWEYNAVLIATLAGIVEQGPGAMSFDRLLGLNLKGPVWVLLALAAGIVGPLAVGNRVEQLAPSNELE